MVIVHKISNKSNNNTNQNNQEDNQQNQNVEQGNENNNTENINCYDRGYCIEETTAQVTDGITSKYYKVTTYININLPFFKLNFNIPITGETRKIERINR